MSPPTTAVNADQRASAIVVKIPDRALKEFHLFHLTKKDLVESIARNGLIPELSDFTVENYALNNSISIEEARKELEPMAFAVSGRDLDEATSAYPQLDALLGIKDDPGCADRFRKIEVNASHDWISFDRVPPECLVRINLA